ncbi:MAG TPA: carboxylesterase family protein, partial [Bryobacteraceae bacterium]
MDRRQMLGTTLISGAAAVALQSQLAFGAEKANGPAPAVKTAASTGNPNLNPPTVSVNGGKLRGLREGKTLSFLGVRYAEAERFEQPKAVQSWEGVKSAQVYGAVCPSPLQTAVSGDELVFPHRFWPANENCQYLNVWTQNLTPAGKKPVMVWMHGGGFTNGSSMEGYAYDGRSLSEFGDVVVVSVNHRLNIIGTLDLSAYGAEYANSRQTGMADLVSSLEWVHDNIEAFGGDPNNVMIFGQSGGGGKVVRLMHMPAAKGLFHKVSAQSGSANYRGTDPAKSIKGQQALAAQLLKNLNLTGSQIDKLKAVPYLELLAAGTAAGQEVAREQGMNVGGWNPIADDVYVMREFCDWADNIPVMSGTTFSEMQGTMTRGDGRKNEWSQAEVDENLTKTLGAKKDDA